jgi:hypothetical protein
VLNEPMVGAGTSRQGDGRRPQDSHTPCNRQRRASEHLPRTPGASALGSSGGQRSRPSRPSPTTRGSGREPASPPEDAALQDDGRPDSTPAGIDAASSSAGGFGRHCPCARGSSYAFRLIERATPNDDRCIPTLRRRLPASPAPRCRGLDRLVMTSIRSSVHNGERPLPECSTGEPPAPPVPGCQRADRAPR